MDPVHEERVREIAREEIAIAERITLLEIAVRELRDEVRKYRREQKTMDAAMMNQFEVVGARFDAVDGRFDAVDGRFDAVDGRLDRVERDMKAGFKAILDRL